MKTRKLSWLAAAGAAALALAACREDGRSARIAVPDPTPPALLAQMDYGLPYAEPAPVRWYEPERGYAWAERAYGMHRAFHDAPPDYAFDYGGHQPWVWETADDWTMYAEPWDDGYRYYYYEPDAAYPYFVHDGDYGYGFDGAGLLVALFDSDGDYLPYDRYDDVAPLAGRYYSHGRDLRNHAMRAQRVPVAYDTWYERAPLIVSTSQPWLRAGREDEGWRAWRDRSGDRELRRFVGEERRRDRETARWRERREDFAQREAARIEPRAVQPDRNWRREHSQARDVRHEERKRFAEARREERRQAAEVRREHVRRDGEAWRARAEHARRDERRWAEAQGRNAAAFERSGGGRGGSEWRGDRGGGGGDWKPDRGGGGGGGWKAEGGGHGKGGESGRAGDKGGGGPGGHHGGGGEKGKGGGKKD